MLRLTARRRIPQRLAAHLATSRLYWRHCAASSATSCRRFSSHPPSSPSASPSTSGPPPPPSARSLASPAGSIPVATVTPTPSSSSSSSSSGSSAASRSALPTYLIIATASFAAGVMLSSQLSELAQPLQQMRQLKERGDAYKTLMTSKFPPPALPASAPSWLHDLLTDPAWEYKDIMAVFPIESHLLYHGLKQPDGIREFYHFVRRTPGAAPSSPSPSQPSSPELLVVFYLGPLLCGHTGIVHGGLTASLIDQISGETAFMAAGPGVFTVNINVNYTKPLIAGSYVRVHGRVKKVEGRKVAVDVTVSDDAAEYANGSVLFVRPKWVPEGGQDFAINAARVRSEEEKQTANLVRSG